MIDKQQIEDIAMELYNNQRKIDVTNPYEIAELIYNINYRQVPESAVVVDKEYLKKELQGLELQARKETAKKIFTNLIADASKEYNKGKISIECLKAWAIEYGVEVK